MVRLTVDVENTVTVLEGDKLDLSPYRAENKLVCVGWAEIAEDMSISEPDIAYFHHNDLTLSPVDLEKNKYRLQKQLDRAKLVIGHNIKHDMQWLYECGFKYEGLLYDTMICEYVLARSLKLGFSLEDSCIRRNVAQKKGDLVREYLDAGKSFAEIPVHTVTEYNLGDIRSTAELFVAQRKVLSEPQNYGLIPTVQMMNEMCQALIEIERNGIKIDMDALDVIEDEYRLEKAQLEKDLRQIVYELMGDTPINLSSPEQVSMVVSGRKIRDKNTWGQIFNLGTDDRGKKKRRPFFNRYEIDAIVQRHTERLRKTKARQCPICMGSGRIQKYNKDGSPRKGRLNLCHDCNTTGLVYDDLGEWAGLGIQPETVHDVSSLGLDTSKEKMAKYAENARIMGDERAYQFFTLISRLNAVDVYLGSFVGGIRRKVLPNHILHPNFNQCVTATARLSSSDPNFQNQPRGRTFPVRRAIISRFPGGKIAEADGAQLEYRCAGELSGCPDVLANVLAGEDAHAFTAKTLTENGQPTNRQGAKSHTFKPLYGGMSGTRAEVAYYTAFLKDRHPRIGAWHVELQEAVLRTKVVRLPSGREYTWPHAKRLARSPNAYTICSDSTQIKNYPVQGWATADLIPISVINLWKLMKQHKCKSLLINTVHDSNVVDVYPGEEELVTRLCQEAMLEGVVTEVKRRYNYTLKVPLGVEVKMGVNWLDTEEVLKMNMDLSEMARLAA
jgi:DNA polymerase I-like protein with 3'-5' exonuclease and polymerase domains